MNIGVLTYHFSLNYGAVMQAWALCRYLAKLGHEATIINYYPWTLPSHAVVRKIKAILCNSRTRSFWQFRKRHFRETRLIAAEDFLSNMGFDCYITGSDQVWNTKFFCEIHNHFNVNYFLKGISDGRKVSYAASLGEGEWSEDERREIAGLLASFHSISVREDFAAEHLREIGVGDAVVVPDPTVLLNPEDYRKLAGKAWRRRNMRVIFAYFLVSVKEGMKIVMELLHKDENAVAYVVVLNPDIGICETCRVKRIWPSPSMWLRYLLDSEMVVTDSFHGMMLSICNSKQFVVLMKPKEPNGNDRMMTALRQCDLGERAVFDAKDAISVMSEQVDYLRIRPKVDLWAERGRAFLREALG